MSKFSENNKRIILRDKTIFRVLKEEGIMGIVFRLYLICEKRKSWKSIHYCDYKIEKISKNYRIDKLEKIYFKEYDNPIVSIVIPVYNQFIYTYYCLRSIKRYSKNISYEIIIADDKSTDLTSELGRITDGIIIIRNRENKKFLLNCNEAAKVAKGKYICFLNNDIQVQKNWLLELIKTIESDEKIGMVGSKMIYPDGRLLEAGGIVWRDASVTQFGNGYNPHCKQFNTLREVDYISGASIIVRRELWNQIGGFDVRYQPAYYEDVDLAFTIKKMGYKVLYQPKSVVIHFEGCSISQSNNQKVNIRNNKEKFYEKWKNVLETEHGTKTQFIMSCTGIDRMIEILVPKESIRQKCFRKGIRSIKQICDSYNSYFTFIKSINADDVKLMGTYFVQGNLVGLKGYVNKILYRDPAVPLDLNILSLNEKKISEYPKLIFQVEKNPMVSIVILLSSGFKNLYCCLQAILDCTHGTSYEIIVGYSDLSNDVKSLNEMVENIKTVKLGNHSDFLYDYNTVAQSAQGKYLVFLDSETQVQRNWLQPLICMMEEDETIGLAGMKLIHRKGLLQEAGGIVWKDGSVSQYGYLCSLLMPECQYRKDVDYVSGTAMLIRASLWKAVDGFDPQYIAGRYGDVDLAFSVRQQGYRVVYQPLSMAIILKRFFGCSYSEKKLLVKNQEKFILKWKNILEKENCTGKYQEFFARDRSSKKKHILVVDHHVPFYDKDAGGKTTFMYLRLFLKLGMQITFIGDDFLNKEPYTTELNQMGIEVLYGNRFAQGWKGWIKENGNKFDYIYLQRPQISQKYMAVVKKHTRAKIFYFTHDLHYLREFREYKLTGSKAHLISSWKYKILEYRLIKKADVIHVVGTYEQKILQNAFPKKLIRNIPSYPYENFLTDIDKNFAERKDLIFVGGFGHPPNVDAVLWFGKHVFPKLLKKIPEIRWYIVGGNPTEEIKKMACQNVIIEGSVPEERLDCLYRSCRMAVAPLRVGAGVKGKVIEAAYYQIPLVTTAIGAEGISTKENAFVVAECDVRMADIIGNLYQDVERLKVISNNTERLIRQFYTSDAALRIIKKDL